MSAFGQSLPPHWVFQGLGQVSGGNGGRGGGWVVGSPTCAGKMALGMSMGFLGIGQSNYLRSRRVVKIDHFLLLFGTIATPREIQKPVVFMIPSTGSGSGIGKCGIHNGYDFWN